MYAGVELIFRMHRLFSMKHSKSHIAVNIM